MRIRDLSVLLAAIETTIFLIGAPATASAQTIYQPPSYLKTSNGAVIYSGVTPWIFDIDSSGQVLGQSSKQMAHGDTVLICPRVLDPQGYPRPWPTNTAFAMFYQSGSGMVMSNLWWLNTSTNYFPVYHDVQQTASVPTIYNVVNSNLTVAVTTTYLYNTNGVATGTVVTASTNVTATTTTTTNYVRTLQTTSVLDTGRVAVVFCATNDFGFDTYNCFLAGYGTPSTISQPVRFRMDFLPSPGLNAAIATQPIDWNVELSNIIYSITSASVNNITTYALRISTNGAQSGYVFIQTP